MSERDDDRATHDALVQIQKVLQLEARKGFGDSAASNGIARFVGDRTSRLMHASDSVAGQRARELNALLTDYARLSERDRERSIAEALSIVGGLLGVAATSLVPPTAAQQRTNRLEPTAPPVQRRTTAHESSVSTPPVRPPSKPTVTRQPSRARIASLSDSVQLLPGVGPSRLKQLEQLGVRTVRDLLRLYPRRHIDYSNVQKINSLLFGHTTTIQGQVIAIDEQRTRTGKVLVDVVVYDGTGQIHAVFFNPHITRVLHIGSHLSMSGRIEQIRGNLALSNPEWEMLDRENLSTGRLTPVYPLVKGLYQKTLRTLMRLTLDAAVPLIQDHLPEELRTQERLLGLAEATEWMHFPDGPTPDDARRNLDLAQKRLAFDEFFVFQIGLVQRKRTFQAQPGNAIAIDLPALRAFADALPFGFTVAQTRATAEILRDMERPEPMTRLLQGDVGSGKTVVAATAALAAIRAGYQVGLMAPTEILAEQHYRGLTKLFEAAPEEIQPRIGYISGKVGGAERTTLYRQTAAGELDLVIGTHALIQGGLEFHNLGLAIVDEQHRFGVAQRTALRTKGANADILVMTATPIPRTLALTLHGDLDVSTLDELPPGRQPIETHWILERQRAHAWRFVREQVEKGRQAFIVFPLVEESEMVDARAATVEHERLSQEVFPDMRLGLLHGRMKPAEKDEVMVRFRDHEIDILVSTSVVEVGIDVPNATVMVIDGAERFGLSQLHQFRGRVGRGSERSTCILISGDTSPEGRQRLQALVDSQDGFKLAQIDLDLRGPGDFMGTRQSGLPELDFATFADVRDLERAREAAERVLDEDPELASAKHALLKARLDAFWATAVTDAN